MHETIQEKLQTQIKLRIMTLFVLLPNFIQYLKYYITLKFLLLASQEESQSALQEANSGLHQRKKKTKTCNFIHKIMSWKTIKQ